MSSVVNFFMPSEMSQRLPATLARVRSSHSTPVVYVVDDDISVRESLELLIRCEGWQPELFASAEEFLSRPRVLVPSCLVLDMNLPDIHGLDLQKRINAERTEMPIIFITGQDDVPMTVQAMKAGAFEFLLKPFQDDVLLSSIRNALDRSRIALGRQAEIRELQNCYASLTPRERQVMALVVSGLLNKQVGWELGISEITVKAHRGNMMQKMKADSLPALVKMAAQLGSIAPTLHFCPASTSSNPQRRSERGLPVLPPKARVSALGPA
jgi:FixJ family two-component response regulator